MHRSWRTLKNKTNWTIHTYRRDFDLLSGQRILSSSDAHDDLLQPLTTRSLDPRWSLRLKSLINEAHKTCEIQSGPRSSTITSKRIVQISHHDRNSNSLTDWSLSLSLSSPLTEEEKILDAYMPAQLGHDEWPEEAPHMWESWETAFEFEAPNACYFTRPFHRPRSVPCNLQINWWIGEKGKLCGIYCKFILQPA